MAGEDGSRENRWRERTGAGEIDGGRGRELGVPRGQETGEKCKSGFNFCHLFMR